MSALRARLGSSICARKLLQSTNNSKHFAARIISSKTQNDFQFLRPYTQRPYSTATESKTEGEVLKGTSEKKEFQAETRMLLDIVARSLYSDKEVFIRELISNASDALEKFRYLSVSAIPDSKPLEQIDRLLQIKLTTDKQNRTITFQDSGIGMTKEELTQNLGTIARSGSKSFIEEIKKQGAEQAGSIIGQFGVGFYSAFMVAEKIEVYTRSSIAGSPGYKWSSDGSGVYEIQEAEGVPVGTKIVVHLKTDCREFSDNDTVKARSTLRRIWANIRAASLSFVPKRKEKQICNANTNPAVWIEHHIEINQFFVSGIIKKYSNFISSPILLNEEQVNSIKPLWLMEPKEVTQEQHIEFYRFIGNSYDKPRFTLHYKTDVPISIRSILYVPEGKPGLFELSRDADVGVALYSRKILIKSKAENILPKWMRFVKGVVDSEDIPLNLSRELLQNSSLIVKLRTVLTNRFLKFMVDNAQKDPVGYDAFYKDYSIFLKEGIITSQSALEKEDVAKLLRFESSKLEKGIRTSMSDYNARQKNDARTIYYLAAPSRELAESSPYYESLKKRDVEVLFCYDTYDELVLLELKEFGGRQLVSVESDMQKEPESAQGSVIGAQGLQQPQVDELIKFLKSKLEGKVFDVRTTQRLDTHPCVIIVQEMAAARHFVRTQAQSLSEENRYALLRPQLEINAKHPIIEKLHKLLSSDKELADMVAQQLFSNAMVTAGLIMDPRNLITHINELLIKALEKH